MRGFAQEVCNRCAKAKPSENVVCVADAPPLSTNAKPKCKRCRKSGVVCNWGDEIPIFMAPIKVNIQALQRKTLSDPKGGTERVVEDADIQGVSRRADGDDMDGVEETTGEVVEEVFREMLNDSIGGGAGVLPGGIPTYDGDLFSSTALALTAALAMRESLRRSEVKSVVAGLERLRH